MLAWFRRRRKWSKACIVGAVIWAVLSVAVTVETVVDAVDEGTSEAVRERTSYETQPKTVRAKSTPTSIPFTQAPIPGFGDGVWRVGKDIDPGTYKTPGLDVSCYWERLSGFGGTMSDVIVNGIGGSQQIVTIKETDVGFLSEGCHWWTQIEP